MQHHRTRLRLVALNRHHRIPRAPDPPCDRATGMSFHVARPNLPDAGRLPPHSDPADLAARIRRAIDLQKPKYPSRHTHAATNRPATTMVAIPSPISVRS